MSEMFDEQISALVDGEVDAEARSFLLRRMAEDDAFRARWSRYHLVGEALRNNLPGATDADFAERVHAAIAQEPELTPHTEDIRSPATRQWRGPALGIAAAASLAAIAVLGFGTSSPRGAVESPAFAEFAASSGTSVALVNSTAKLNRQLQPYVRTHNGHATGNPMRGHVPYVRLVGHDLSTR